MLGSIFRRDLGRGDRTPGPDTAVTIRNTLLGGRPGGMATAFGVSVGQAVWAFAASIGVVALLVASEPLFLAIRYAGIRRAIESVSGGVLVAIGLRIAAEGR